MTLAVLFHQLRFRPFKSFYLGYACRHLRREFPKLRMIVAHLGQPWLGECVEHDEAEPVAPGLLVDAHGLVQCGPMPGRIADRQAQ